MFIFCSFELLDVRMSLSWYTFLNLVPYPAELQHLLFIINVAFVRLVVLFSH